MPTTSHFKIFDYWRDKAILASGEIKSYPDALAFPDYIPVVFDQGEPCCWACDRFAVRDRELSEFFDNNSDKSYPDFYKKLYGLKTLKSNLNRCHIIAKSLGGEDSPDNLFLMCEECHVLSPDTTDKEAFFRWVYDRRKTYTEGRLILPEVMKRIDTEVRRRGLPSLKECLDMIDPSYEFCDIKEYMRGKVTTHWHHTSESSMIITMTNWILHNWAMYLLDKNE